MAKPVHHTLHSPDPAAGKVALNARSAAHYLRLKNRALQLAKAFDLSEASYHQLFEQGLIPLDQFLTRQHGQVAGPAVEAAFAEAARALCFPRRSSAADRFPTIDSILDLASAQLKERLRAGEEDIFAQLIKGGAVVQPVAGMLIQPETGIRMPEGDGRKPAVRFAPKTAQLVTALMQMGIFADDLFIYRGRVLPSAMREVSYAVFEIPRIGRQIAVCDQIGEITLVANTMLPISIWGNLTKSELKARPEITPIRYTAGWIEAIEKALLDGGAIKPAQLPKLTLRAPRRAPLLTEAMIIGWLKLYFEKEGNWPTVNGDPPVWEKDRYGMWIQNSHESWSNLDKCI